jgi:hypothetical protein
MQQQQQQSVDSWTSKNWVPGWGGVSRGTVFGGGKREGEVGVEKKKEEVNMEGSWERKEKGREYLRGG